MSKKILFIGNDAGRTGAPIVLLHFMQWIKEHTDFQIRLLLLNDGALLDDFQVIAETWVWNHRAKHNDDFFRRGINKAVNIVYDKKVNKPQIIKKIKIFQPDLVYVNTAATGNLVTILQQELPKIPFILHIHELEFILRYHCGDSFKQSVPYIHHFICVSEQVKQNLIDNYQVKPENNTVVRPFLPLKDLSQVTSYKEKMGIPSDAFVVGCAGVGGWRKGADLLLPIAKAVSDLTQKEIHFVWLGFDKDSSDIFSIQFDAEKIGIAQKIHLLEKVKNPLDYFAAYDLFLLTSREDPYPLVCLEAAALGKPIVCFQDSGGIPEFVQDECGVAVPYLNIAAMAQAIVSLYEDRERLRLLGTNAKKKIYEVHDVHVASKQILEVINSYI